MFWLGLLRRFAQSACLAGACGVGVAQAQVNSQDFSQPSSAVVRLDALPLHVKDHPAPLDVAFGLGTTMTVQEVAALPRERFVPFDPSAMHPISIDQPLWLRMRLEPSRTGHVNWLLEIPTVIVDRYEAYQRDASGAWQMAQAGDRVAHTHWPTRSLRPSFPLQTSANGAGSGVQDVYIRVVHQLPSTLRPMIVEAGVAAQRDSTHTLWVGVVAGLMIALLLICLQMALSFRDLTYLWYAAYLMAGMLCALAYSGVGHQFLWPTSSEFANIALPTFILAGFSLNLLFVNAMLGKWLGKMYRWATAALVAACFATFVHVVMVESYATSAGVLMALTVLASTLILSTAIHAWRKRVPYSGYWLLIYLPFLMMILMAMAGNLGIPSIVQLPAYTPVLAIMAEAMAMMFCLNAYSRESHAQAARDQVVAQRDPLTGFLNESHFLELASKAWLRASQRGRDMALAYVHVESKEMDLSAMQFEALMLRSVRMVRIAMREADAMGRIGRNVIGIAMPDMKPGEDLNARLSRLVALGLMLDPSDGKAQAINFTLAVGTRRAHSENFGEVNKRLHELLITDSDRRPRAIRYLNAQ